MAVIDQNALLRGKDENGNERLFYPITKLECVDGAEDLIHYDQEQELTAAQKAQVLKNIGGLCAPEGAQINQFLKVTAVDENGNVTAVETAEVEAGSSGSGGSTETVQSDWNVTDETDPAYIKNKPFYEETDIWVSILPSTTYNGFAYNSTYGCYMYDKGAKASYSLTIGNAYRVTWDGTTYECVAQDASAVLSGAIYLGNASAWGLSGNGEPFIAMVVNGYEAYVSLTDTADGGTHVIAIEEFGDVVHKIDGKYLYQSDWDVTDDTDPAYIKNKPFGQTFISATLIDDTFNYVYSSEASAWEAESMIPNTSGVHLVLGNTYIVTFDGVEYVCECWLVNGSIPFIGNPIITGDEDNGMPFAIAEDVTGELSGTAGFSPVVIDEPDPTVATTVTYSLKITYDGYAIKKLDSAYLPDDIGGLPESTASDAGKVLTVDSSGTAVWETPTASSTSSLPSATTTDAGKVLTVDSSGAAVWEAPTVSSGSALPEVTVDDNGRVLGVVDGMWAKTVMNAENVIMTDGRNLEAVIAALTPVVLTQEEYDSIVAAGNVDENRNYLIVEGDTE